MQNTRSLACRALLFDLDGTLIDSRERIERLWRWWAERRGVDFESVAPVMYGRPAVETIRLAAPHLVAVDEIEALEAEEISDMHDVHLIPGALELLAHIDGAPWGIVTSGSTRAAAARIAHVTLPRPAVLVTADEIRNGKPAPDGFLLGAKQLGVRPQDCIVVEDAPVGVAAGKAAGMRVVAIASTYSPEALRDADALVARLTDIDLHADAGGITLRFPP
jgi:mannitol-1-/sugar-/sorbitol-6-phosphatase